jgi:pimeloyl-ACP methyl ester carboxylesterase
MRSFRAAGSGLSLRVLEWTAPAPAMAELPGRPTILLLHGFQDAGGTWDRVAPLLAARGHRVLAPDLRGFGESDRIAADPGGGYYHFPDYVADVARFVDGEVQGDLVVVGHSMGGTVATLYAGARPERVAKLALVEGIGPPDHEPSAAPDRMRTWLNDLAKREATRERTTKAMTETEALARLAMNHPNVPREVLATRLPHLTRPMGDGLAWCFDPLHRTTAPTPFYAATYRAFAARIACPVLYVSGGARGFRPPDEAARLAAFPNATHVDLPEAGHMIHWTEPSALAKELSTFLER